MAVPPSSREVSYDNVDEVDSTFDVVDPAYVLVYRRVERSTGVDSRFVSCVRVEVTRRFARRIFGQATTFIDAAVFYRDVDEKEQMRSVTVPSVFVFEEGVPDVETAKAVVTENRTLFRHFAPVLKGAPTMRLLYERPLFRVRQPGAQSQPPQPTHEVDNALYQEMDRLKLEKQDDLRTAEKLRSPSPRSGEETGDSVAAQSSGSRAEKAKRPSLKRIVPPLRVPKASSQAIRPSEDKRPRPSKHRHREQKFSLDIDPNAKVSELKKKIYKARGYLPEQQHLVFNGVALTDDDRLNDFDIADSCVLMLWLRAEDGTMRRVDL